MLQFKGKYSALFFAVLSFLTCVTLSETYKFYSVLFVPVFIGLILLYRAAWKEGNLRLRKYACLFAGTLSFLMVTGHSLAQVDSFLFLYETSARIFLSSVKWVGFFSLFYSLILPVFKLLSDPEDWLVHPDTSVVRKRDFFVFWVVIFALWLPYFLVLAPGILTADSYRQISFVMEGRWSNHHPVAHTFLISIFVKIGIALDDINIGVGLNTVFHMLFLSGVFAFCIYYMKRNRVNQYIRTGTFVLLALVPLHPLMSVTMWKDVIFSGMILLFTVVCIEIIKNKGFLQKKRNWILTLLCMFGVCVFKNNGVYIVLLTLVVLVFALKAYRIRVFVLAVNVGVMFSIYSGPFFAAMGVVPGSIREMLSIPMQQIARTVKYHGGQLSP